MYTPQNKAILEYLKQGKGLTQAEAADKFGCWRLSGRIYDLREAGYPIETRIETKGNKTFARYFLRVI